MGFGGLVYPSHLVGVMSRPISLPKEQQQASGIHGGARRHELDDSIINKGPHSSANSLVFNRWISGWVGDGQRRPGVVCVLVGIDPQACSFAAGTL